MVYSLHIFPVSCCYTGGVLSISRSIASPFRRKMAYFYYLVPNLISESPAVVTPVFLGHLNLHLHSPTLLPPNPVFPLPYLLYDFHKPLHSLFQQEGVTLPFRNGNSQHQTIFVSLLA